MKSNSPIPASELERLMRLSDLDPDYSGLSDSFKDLTQLAAKVAGTEISLVNLIDSYTQWSVSSHGIELEQMPREDSVCQYTIMDKEPFEVKDLSLDPRFSDKYYVKGPDGLRYYYGLPLDYEGQQIGALCVLDTHAKKLGPEKVELLKLIASEVVNRIRVYASLDQMKSQLEKESETKRKVAHDIRGPLAGIIGLSELVTRSGDTSSIDDLIDFVKLIHKSSLSLLDLADEILTEGKPMVNTNDFSLSVFKEKLERLYLPQARTKGIVFEVQVSESARYLPLSKNKLLQITGNLISNAIKFTPAGGKVSVNMDLLNRSEGQVLSIEVADTGIGISRELADQILQGQATSTDGTAGEAGYGFGLSLVRHLVSELKGNMKIDISALGGTAFRIELPQRQRI